MELPLDHTIKKCTEAGELCDLISARLDDLQQDDISQAFKQLSFLGVTERSGRIDEAANKMVRKANANKLVFSPDHIAEILSAHAKMRKPVDTAFLQNLTEQAIAAAPQFEARALSNTMAALAKMKIKPDDRLLEALTERAKTAAPEFSPQSVANTLSAITTLEVKADKKMVEKLSERASLAVEYFRPEDAAKTINALATMHMEPDKKMMAALGKRATMGIDGNPDGAGSLYSMATMDLDADQQHIEELCARTIAPSEKFGTKEVSNTLWALAKLGVRSPNAPQSERIMTARSTTSM